MALVATLEDDDTVTNYVDGEWKAVTAEEHQTVTNPATGEELDAASLFTDSGSAAREFRNRVQGGNLAVNAGTAAPMAFFHFGGQKASFFGDLHAQGEDMIQFYTDKTTYIERWA